MKPTKEQVEAYKAMSQQAPKTMEDIIKANLESSCQKYAGNEDKFDRCMAHLKDTVLEMLGGRDAAKDNRKAKIDLLANLGCKEFLGNVKANIVNNAFKTKWEKILSKFIVEQLANMHAEINVLRNFANAVDVHLEHCVKLAKEQDNHHHYKVFADRVAKLLEAL